MTRCSHHRTCKHRTCKPRAGYCPKAVSSTGGHRFDVQSHPTACMDCGVLMDDIYVPGTYLPRRDLETPSWGERGPQSEAEYNA